MCIGLFLEVAPSNSLAWQVMQWVVAEAAPLLRDIEFTMFRVQDKMRGVFPHHR